MTAILRVDRDWAKIDGQLCRVSEFSPLGAIIRDGQFVAIDKSIPFAVVKLECPVLADGAEGYVWHRVDFEHLWKAFQGRGIAPDEEVLIIWTRKQYRSFAGLFSAFLPKLWVMVWKGGSYEHETDPRLKSQRRPYQEMVPLTDWKPEVMN